ncbi:MAG: hypothetical protein CL693_14260 [Cellvibrionaceae bacterium]|nr:hypothetical protein [Cellvibrionaceae bacterium]|tara:strand:+ start:10495 stop:12321 length:1827 start_codon:yes stop_codon:yes gene_type:complete
MNTDSPLLEQINKLRLPPQEQTSLSFCDSNRASRVAAWAAQLPATQISHTSVLLYQALPEVARLDSAPGNRLEILEHLRPYVQQCIQGLAQSFLNQPLIMPPEAMKTAVIAQALQKHMSNGYSQTIADLLHKRPNGDLKPEEQQMMVHALHRAITGMGLQYYRNAQIYTQVSSQLWLELNTLYLIAEQLQLLQKSWTDPLLNKQTACTIEQCFQRVLLLACCRPNQLRQQEVSSVYDALESWSQFTSLTSCSESQRNLFTLNLDSSFPPSYKSQWKEKTLPPQLRELNFSPLLDSLDKQIEQGGADQNIIDIPASINQRLLSHLTISWGSEHQREQPRRISNGILEVAVGLTNVHFHLAQQLPFEQFMRQFGNQKRGLSSHFTADEMPGSEDPWADAFDAEKGHAPLTSFGASTLGQQTNKGPTAKNEKYPTHQVQMCDASPGGYCLDWRQKIPSQAKAGELIALREPRRHQWSLGVIRWVKQHKGTSQLGIQLIAQQARAVAAQQLQKTGADNVFMRAFLSDKAGGDLDRQALLTAAVPFQVQNKVNLNDAGNTSLAQLTHLEYSTSSLCLFRYRHLEDTKSATTPPVDALNSPPPELPKDEFSSDW